MRGLEKAVFLFALTAGVVLAQPSLQMRLGGRWWRNAQTAEKLALSADQQKRMDAIFDEERPNLIDLSAALDQEEARLEPLLDSDPPDAARVKAQIDRVAQARAELEKANANMLLGIRLVLSQAQWRNLQTAAPGPRPAPVPRKVR